jgi:hypothetical protein
MNALAPIFALLAFGALSITNVDASERPHPDLQGTWILSNLTQLVRPPGIDSLVITPGQAAKIEAQIRARFEDPSVPNEPTEFLDERRIERINGELRSSLLIDPTDGKLPTTATYDRKLAAARAGALTATDGPEQRPMPERCITSGAGQPPMLSVPSNNLHQIVQTDDSILIFAEALHDARVIRMNAQHHPAAITSLLGDSIGRWHGGTLVIETKYFSPTDLGRLLPGVALFISPDATVTERLTLLSSDELFYEFTVDDPVHYTRAWRAESHFLRSTDPLIEYACHEGNYSLTHILQGGRVADNQ